MNTTNAPLNRKLRMALIGGGGNAFIGPVHFRAAVMDHRAELVAGALSSDPEKARSAAAEFGITKARAYGSFRELIECEAKQPEEKRIDFVTIATPNNTHFEIAAAALEAGFNVVCDKPMTTALTEAETLVQLVESSGAVFAVTHSYSAYPLAVQLRAMVQGGEIGTVRAARVNYIQGGLLALRRGEKPSRRAWIIDPVKCGPSGTLADIGVHAFHLLRFASGLVPEELTCTSAVLQPVRPLEDYAHVILRCSGGALGAITVSQVTHGRLNDLTIEIDGTAGSLVWRQEEPGQLILRRLGQPPHIYQANPRAEYLDPAARALCRLPGGHPEGLHEAFANLYGMVFDAIALRGAGRSFETRTTSYPNVYDGLAGVRFVERCLASSRENSTWQRF